MALDWFVLAVIATLLWSIAAILVKFVRLNYIKSPIGYIIITAPTSLIILALLFFGEFQIPATQMLMFIFTTSVLAFLGYWLYISAMHKEEISRIITLYGLQPLAVLIIATIFLKETLTLTDYLAFPLIITGSMLISIRKVEERFHLSTGVILTIISALVYAVHAIFLKLVAEVNFISVSILRQVGWMLITALLFIFSKDIRRKTKQDLKQINKKRLPLVFIAESLGIIGMVFAFLAIQRGPVSLVTLITGSEGLFVIILAAILSIFIPNILKEEITKKTISLKIVSALLILGGLYLIAT